MLHTIYQTSRRIKNNIYFSHKTQKNYIYGLLFVLFITALMVLDWLVLYKFGEFESPWLLVGAILGLSSLIPLIWLCWKEKREGQIYIDRQ